MKEKIVQFLKSKLSGVSESFLTGVADTFSKTVKEEKDIEATFTDGIIDALKFSASQLQIEGDRRATEAQKTALKNFQEKHGLNEDGTPIRKPGRPPKKDADPDDSDEGEKMPEWAKKILADNTELKQKIEAQEQEKATSHLSGKVSAKLKEKGIPESYFKGRNLVPKSEAEIDQLITAVESDYNGFKQEMAEKGVVISVPPVGGGSPGDKSTIDEYLNEKFPKEPQGKVLIPKN